MSDVTIRREGGDDLLAIDRVNREAFGSEEEALMVRTVRESGEPTISLVAIANGNVVGHVLFTRATISSSDRREWAAAALAPMGVLPEHQRQGIGSKLVERGLRECLDSGYERAIVLGHPSFYTRFGFRPAQQWDIRWEYSPPIEAFMAVALVPGALEECSGIARYQAAFDPTENDERRA
jgi:putative acetyltransferase